MGSHINHLSTFLRKTKILLRVEIEVRRTLNLDVVLVHFLSYLVLVIRVKASIV